MAFQDIIIFLFIYKMYIRQVALANSSFRIISQFNLIIILTNFLNSSWEAIIKEKIEFYVLSFLKLGKNFLFHFVKYLRFNLDNPPAT